MKWIDCTTDHLPRLCKEMQYTPTPFTQCITCVQDGVPIAGVVYDTYLVKSIATHIWIAHGRVPSRAWYWAIFDYPFNTLGVHKIIGQTSSANAAIQKLDTHFGFVEEARVVDCSPEGDMILYTMTREQCRVLNSPRWGNVPRKLEAA